MAHSLRRLRKELKAFDPLPCWLTGMDLDELPFGITFHVRPLCSNCRSDTPPAGRCYCALCPYAAGSFRLHLAVPGDYPFKPPRASFEDARQSPGKPHVPCAFTDASGCLCTCGGFQSNWSPALTIRHLLTDIVDNMFEPLGFVLEQFHTDYRLDPMWRDRRPFIRLILLGLGCPESPLSSLNPHLVRLICGSVWRPEVMAFLSSRRCVAYLDVMATGSQPQLRRPLHVCWGEMEADEAPADSPAEVLRRVKVKTLTGEAHFLPDLDCSMLVEEVKGLLQEVTGTAARNQRLIFAGKELVDERRLGEYGLVDESTLHMVLRLEGGAVKASMSNLCVLDHDVLDEMKHDWPRFDARVRDLIND